MAEEASAPAVEAAAPFSKTYYTIKNWDGISLDDYPELKEVARIKLGETEKSKSEALTQLRAELTKFEGKKPSDDILTEAYLLRFLRARKFDVQRAKDVIIALHCFKTDNPAFDGASTGEEFRAMYGSGFMRILRCTDKAGRRVSLLLPKRLPKPIDVTLFMRWNLWSLDRMARDPFFQVNGAIIVEDFENMTILDSVKLNMAMSPSFMFKSFHFIRRCAAYRLAGIYAFNHPKVMSYLMAAMRHAGPPRESPSPPISPRGGYIAQPRPSLCAPLHSVLKAVLRVAHLLRQTRVGSVCIAPRRSGIVPEARRRNSGRHRRPFMSEKMRSRVHLLGGDRSPLDAIIGAEHLPQEMGGTLEEDPMAWLEEQIELQKAGK